MEVEVQDREHVEVRDKVEAQVTEEEDKTKTKSAQTCDDTCMNMFYADTSCGTMSHNVMCAQG